MDTTTISDKQAEDLGAIDEDHFFDRKSKDIAPGKLTKTISGFANADGGELFVGIEDDGLWKGAEDVEQFNGHLQAFEALFPYGTEFDYEFLRHASLGTIVLHATVQKSREIKRASDGKAYVRRGAQSVPVDDEASLARQKGLTTHETEALNYSVLDLIESPIIAGFVEGVVPSNTPEKWLRKQQLILNDLPTVAGTLLFHDEPQIHLPKASVKLYRYTTSDAEGSREHLAYPPIAIEGCLYDQIADAVHQTTDQVEQIPTLDAEGLTKIKYPETTLHEIITNAVIHRDYAVNDDVHVRIFDNRIEVQSPGSLPANITAKNILTERFSRNPSVVRLLNKFPDAPNQDVGEGLNTAFAAMRELDLRDPEIKDTGTSVLVIIWHEALASPESRIAEYLKVRSSINNREARALLNRPEADRSVRRLFEKLVDSGVIERVPGTIRGGSRYRLKSASEPSVAGE
ncbi:ATP-binding protein [Curtobacterium sp. MCBD17_026]|uniref:ATP-binding protein n=1 Tax=Curtobacterium sp. MCBD17_026 TaxID=2175621 RepID=UPI000DA985F7|nr:ATP-binding protein [Curtobacterium sp. MCBD17_026]WIB69541.1 ATP-binding protein [Curtobacterium sp. MCBD17_026]